MNFFLDLRNELSTRQGMFICKLDFSLQCNRKRTLSTLLALQLRLLVWQFEQLVDSQDG
jgi:hypothetical protein